MKIGVIGAKGFIGGRISVSLLGKHEVYMILREDWKDIHYDIIIDANGSSKKYLAEKDPVADFKASVDSVMYYINHLKYDKYIYLSSIDAYIVPENNYGINRSIAEDLVEYYCECHTIIRLCSVIGENATKGIVYDILNDMDLFVTLDSFIQVISIEEVAKKISNTLHEYNNETLEFYSTEGIFVKDICSMFGKNPEISFNAETQFYAFEPSDLGFKTSEQYLKETFHERMV
jgi:dTDP-4-dehydrorhamnose reductase